MNESATRAELIAPKLKANGWGVVEGSKILRERNVCKITDGRIQVGGGRKRPLIADYILVYKGIKLAVVEAKSDELDIGEGVAQAKLYAQILNLDYTYSTNGKDRNHGKHRIHGIKNVGVGLVPTRVGSGLCVSIFKCSVDKIYKK